MARKPLENTPNASPKTESTSDSDTQHTQSSSVARPSPSAPPPPLTKSATHYLQRQARIGMRAASKSIQRLWDVPGLEWWDDSPMGMDGMSSYGPPPTPTTMDNWPDILPKAYRTSNPDPTKDTNIKVTLGQARTLKKDEEAKPNEVTNTTPLKGGGTVNTAISRPSMKNDDKGYDGTLTDEQKAVIEQIRTNRAAVNADKMKLQKYDGAYGYVYGGKPSEDTTPKALTGTADASTPEGKRKQAEQWIWEEMAHEGSSASINAYDSQMVTWGRGLGAKTGGLNPTMTMLMKNPDIANRFRSLGMAFKGDWLAVNLTTGAVETGKNALAIIQTDPHLLAALVEVGEGNTHGDAGTTDDEKAAVKQDVADAQWAGIQGAGTGKIPQFVLDGNWSKAAVQIGAHITHWGGKYGWHVNSAGYKGTGGDITKMVDMVVKLLAETPNANGAYSVRSSGPALIQNLRAWGGGAGLSAITSTYKSESLTDDQISMDRAYDGYLIIKQANPKKEGESMPVYTKKM